MTVKVQRSEQFSYALWDPVCKATLRSEDAAEVDRQTATPQDLADVWTVHVRRDDMKEQTEHCPAFCVGHDGTAACRRSGAVSTRSR